MEAVCIERLTSRKSRPGVRLNEHLEHPDPEWGVAFDMPARWDRRRWSRSAGIALRSRRIGVADYHHSGASRLEIRHARPGLELRSLTRWNLHWDNPGLRQLPRLKSGRFINELLAPAF
jgi:hypothetical protein